MFNSLLTMIDFFAKNRRHMLVETARHSSIRMMRLVHLVYLLKTTVLANGTSYPVNMEYNMDRKTNR
jgi:hypothetical protein